MTNLFGQTYSKRQLLQYVGRVEQLGGVRRFRLAEGKGAGVEQIQVRTGGGLTYYVSPDRGMDISLAEFHGIPLTWQSENGDVHPSYYESEEDGWLRSFPGGLVHTCGLTSIGSPTEDVGERLGLHGRISHQPAEHVCVDAEWQEDEYVMTLKGKVRQTRVFGENLELQRTIHSQLGENKIFITDRVENHGFEACPHMILYHCNFGFPFLGPDTELMFPAGHVRGREADLSAEGLNRMDAPQSHYPERVYYHEVFANSFPEVMVRNPRLGITVTMSYRSAELPRLIQCKIAQQGLYLLAIEPANAWVEGRAVERERGTLQMLEPGEIREYHLSFEFLDLKGRHVDQ